MGFILSTAAGETQVLGELGVFPPYYKMGGGL